jgi:flavin reductase (DIM6/NTAB) family NADH-FMN oxidoreductase RutF
MYCPNGFKPGTREQKDSLVNVEATGEFVFNLCTANLGEQMVVTSIASPSSVDEMAEAGLEAADCVSVKPPRVKASPVAMECKYLQTVDLPSNGDSGRSVVVIGQVVGIHIADDVITDDGMIDMKALRPLARLGYIDYAAIEPDQIFSMATPGDPRFAEKD